MLKVKRWISFFMQINSMREYLLGMTKKNLGKVRQIIQAIDNQDLNAFEQALNIHRGCVHTAREETIGFKIYSQFKN
jgi:hypothetical protein